MATMFVICEKKYPDADTKMLAIVETMEDALAFIEECKKEEFDFGQEKINKWSAYNYNSWLEYYNTHFDFQNDHYLSGDEHGFAINKVELWSRPQQIIK